MRCPGNIRRKNWGQALRLGDDGASCPEGLSWLWELLLYSALKLWHWGSKTLLDAWVYQWQKLALLIVRVSSFINLSKKFWIFKKLLELLELEQITETSSLFTWKFFGGGSDPGFPFQSAAVKATSCSCWGQIKPLFLLDRNSGRKPNNSQQRPELTTVPSKSTFKDFNLEYENTGNWGWLLALHRQLDRGLGGDVVLPFWQENLLWWRRGCN